MLTILKKNAGHKLGKASVIIIDTKGRFQAPSEVAFGFSCDPISNLYNPVHCISFTLVIFLLCRLLQMYLLQLVSFAGLIDSPISLHFL